VLLLLLLPLLLLLLLLLMLLLLLLRWRLPPLLRRFRGEETIVAVCSCCS
jgi:hypothetical protein